MLQKSTLQFLQNLKLNNNKPWMDANRTAYEAAKADWEQMVNEVIAHLSKTEPLLADLQAKGCTFRMNRDVRFSKNKEPYKCNFGASIKLGGKKSPYAGYYFHVEPGSVFVAGGYWLPEAPILNKIRQEIDYGFADFKKAISSKKFKETYADGLSTEYTLVNPPKGYDAENPAIEFLKRKSFTVSCIVPDKNLLAKDAAKQVAAQLSTLKPFIDFLNRAIE
jgi:uncharacterized protein (TIGR02453 family)